MHGPVLVRTIIDAFHGDAVVNRTDVHAQVATDALIINDFEVTLTLFLAKDCLMRGVLAGDVTKPTLDAQVLIDARPLPLARRSRPPWLPIFAVKNECSGPTPG